MPAWVGSRMGGVTLHEHLHAQSVGVVISVPHGMSSRGGAWGAPSFLTRFITPWPVVIHLLP